VVCVHRDFHSRNLMLAERRNPGILDFQDAVVGPVSYDLVSLLKDCYIEWPRARVQDWVMDYFKLATQSGILGMDQESRFLRWFDLMGVQRHLKAAGIFARLQLRDGRRDYLQYLPRTLGYVVQAADTYPELASLGAFIEHRVLSALSGLIQD
jgi:aminoglycoside/choline kinase family phosphotransferase